MLLDDDVVANREPKASAFSCGLCCEEWIEHLLFHFRWNTDAIVAYPDFDAVPKVFSRDRKDGLVAIAISLLALRCRIEAVRD
jgi:hypothetical protein